MRESKRRKGHMGRKRAGFGKIWAEITIPILLLTLLAMMIYFEMMVMYLLLNQKVRAGSIAYEEAYFLKGQDLTDARQNSRMLDMERFQMVAVLYDEQENLIGASPIGQYDKQEIPAEVYRSMLEKLKTMRMAENRNEPGFDEVDLTGISCLYGRERFSNEQGNFTMRYAAAINPYVKMKKSIYFAGIGVILAVTGLATVIAGHYYKIYQEQIKAQEYYRKTSNALAHDLKTPLMAISGYAEILQENIHTDKRDYYACGILKNVAVMNSLIENMLELARLENPRLTLIRENIDLCEISSELAERFKAELWIRDIEIAVQGEAAVSADRALMSRALENLIGNAVKYTPEHGRIMITAKDGTWQIRNTGVNIPEEKLKSIWEPFVKGEDARGQVSGTGIGLTIVKEILDLHAFAYRMGNDGEDVKAEIMFAHRQKAAKRGFCS